MSNATGSRRSSVVGRPFEQLRHEMDQLFDDFIGIVPRSRGRVAGEGWQASMSVWEDETALHVELDLPGVSKENLEVAVERGRLQVSAVRPLPEESQRYLHNERGFGRTDRVVDLPDSIDPESVEAQLRDGVLHLKLGKKQEAKPKRIEVQIG